MPYNGNIPQATDQISQSQSQILDNFTAIQTVVAVNHVTFDDPSGNQGKHKWVSFPVQASAPAFAAGEEGLYSLAYNNNTNTKNELFVHKQTSSGTQDIPCTASIISQNAAVGANTNGWSYLPSGILMHWETASGISGLQTVTVDATYPAFNAIFTVILSPYSSSTSDANFAVRLVDILSTTQFRIYISSRTSTGAAVGGVKMLIIGR